MTDVYASISTKKTPQSKKAKPEQVENNAGGYVFKIDDEARLHRFLTIGSEGGTYYSTAAELTRENAQIVVEFARNKGKYLVDQILEVSEGGRAPKQQPAIFALAVAASEGDVDTRRYALSVLPRVCRTASTLFTFLKYVQNFRGWGRALRRAVAAWYESKPTEKLTYQVMKYRQREGFTHRDVLRLSHPAATTEGNVSDPKAHLFNYITGKEADLEMPGLQLVQDFVEAQQAYLMPGVSSVGTGMVVDIINRGSGLSWEMLPDAALNEPAVWEALLDQGIPQGALLRQLPRLTRLGLTTGATGKLIVAQITDPERLKKARIHPINVLVAAKTYAQGHGRGGKSWTPARNFIDALDEAFYLAYGNVEPAGKRTLIALDCSGSMGAPAGGLPVSCLEVAAALALVIGNTEPEFEIVGFSAGSAWPVRRAGRYRAQARAQVGPVEGIDRLSISPRQRLDDAVRAASYFSWGGTDCALPMLWAKQEGLEFDTIIEITDNETWFGDIHPHQALLDYRHSTGIDTKLVVAGLTSTGFSIADPSDAGMLDVAGFDSAVPQLINDFSRGDI